MEDAQLQIGELLARLDAIAAQIITKADLAAFEVRMLRRYIGTTIALTGVVFAGARFIK